MAPPAPGRIAPGMKIPIADLTSPEMTEQFRFQSFLIVAERCEKGEINGAKLSVRIWNSGVRRTVMNFFWNWWS